MRSHISKRANNDRNDILEEFLTRSLANQIFTSGFSVRPFGFSTHSPGNSSGMLSQMGNPATSKGGLPDFELWETDATICNDIRGRDRACCNTAVRCFDDVKNVVDELDNQPVDSFSMMTACRRVSAELKRDRLCVQNSLSRCGGPDRNILQRRFTNRVDALYNQFYKHCSRDTETTSQAPSVSNTDLPASQINASAETNGQDNVIIPPWLPPNNFPDATTHDHEGRTHSHGGIGKNSNASPESSAIIAGAITGGIVLALVILVVIIFWCKNQRDKNGSNGSLASAGILFNKRTSGNVVRIDNNNKTPAVRQDSTIYAEIDEALVNPGYKPPVPGSLPHEGYLSPVSDDESSCYTMPNGRSASVPAVTTRGQLSYGPILAANGAPGQHKALFYHSTTLTDSNINQKDMQLMQKIAQSKIGSGNESAVGVYFTKESADIQNDEGLDDYEEPVSAHNSIRYTDVHDPLPPYQTAPDVPETSNTPSNSSAPLKTGVKVLPSNPLAPTTKIEPLDSANSEQPIAKPRRKKRPNSAEASPAVKDKTSVKSDVKLAEKQIAKRAELLSINRDSTISDSSTKSSHHYFVLEPGHTAMDYENSVSSSKVV